MSVLNADFGHLQKEVDKVSNADFLHFDIMDGHFVPNISFGASVVKDIKTDLKKVVHLMIDNPENYVDSFVKAGADQIIVHIELGEVVEKVIKKIKRNKIKIGIALNPRTKLHWLRYYLDDIDSVLIMSVKPGFGGQKFDHNVLPKIDELRQMFDKDICVDGGINEKTGRMCTLAGASSLLSGTCVFGSKDPMKTVEKLRKI